MSAYPIGHGVRLRAADIRLPFAAEGQPVQIRLPPATRARTMLDPDQAARREIGADPSKVADGKAARAGDALLARPADALVVRVLGQSQQDELRDRGKVERLGPRGCAQRH